MGLQVGLKVLTPAIVDVFFSAFAFDFVSIPLIFFLGVMFQRLFRSCTLCFKLPCERFDNIAGYIFRNHDCAKLKHVLSGLAAWCEEQTLI